MKLDKRTILILAGIVGGGIFLNWLLTHYDVVGDILGFLWGLIFPFIVGYVIAFLLNLPMTALERLFNKNHPGRLKRPLSFTLTILIVLAALAFVILLVVPELWKTILTLSSNMPTYLANLQKAIEPYLEYVPQVEEWVQGLNVDWQSIVTQVTAWLSNGAGNFFSSAVGVATSIVGGVVSFFVGVVFAVYLLLDKEHLTAQFKGLLQAYLPQKRYQKLEELGQLTYHTYARFVSGQCAEALIVGLIYLAVLLIGRFDYPLLIAVVVGFTTLIPMIGAYLGCFFGTFLLLISMGLPRTIVFVILFVVIQQIEGNFIYPHVVGSSVGLPPLWILVAVMLGGGLGGILGMLFFLPLFSVIYSLVFKDTKSRLKAKGIMAPAMADGAPQKPKKHRFSFRRRHRADSARPGADDDADAAGEAPGPAPEDENGKNKD